MKHQYVFGYGSLMNPKSLARTIPGEKVLLRATLSGYQRRFNVQCGDYLYLNIVPRAKKDVTGVVIPVNDTELEALKRREYMYACVDISSRLSEALPGPVYAFIAPDVHIPSLKIPRTYIDTCLAGVPEEERRTWLADSIIENGFEEDSSHSVYQNLPNE